jgi:GNAT superfamily N-acetyltransferase
LTKLIEHERDEMLYQTGEGIQTAAEQAAQIEQIRSAPNSILYAAVSDSEWLGYAMALGGELRIDRHAALVVVEVAPTRRRQGVGTFLLSSLEIWATQVGVRRLELSSLSTNHAALNLYLKLGYEREGIKRGARLVGNQFVDEWFLAKLLLY